MGLLALLAGCGGGGGGSNPPPPPPPPVDTNPDAFVFTAQTDTALSAVVSSNEITVAGIAANAPVTITGGEYSISGGAFTSAAGTVANGQRLQVRVTASSQFSTAVSAVLSVGAVSATFSATTLAMDTTPDAFQFQRSVNATRGAWAASASTTIAGINTAAPVTIADGEYAIAGGTFTSAAGTISAGQTLTVRGRASSGYSRNTRVRVTVGGVTADFDVTSELPNYVPDAIAYDGQDVVYLLNSTNRFVFRWSIPEAHYLDPYDVGSVALAPTTMAFSTAHHRLYLGYDTGAIRQIDVNAATPAEVAFANLASAVTSLGNAGNFLIAQAGSYSYDGGFILNSNGVVTDQGGYYYGYSRETAWDSVTSRVYFTRDGLSPNDLHYDVIDQATGLVTSSDETPYHGSYNIQPPIRVSTNGQFVLLGSGDIYAQDGLTWSGALGSPVADARWLANGSLVTLTTTGNQTILRRLGATSLPTLEQLTYTGQALRVLGTDSRMAVLLVNNNTVQIQTYVPNDDSDGDGVLNTVDAFPLDRAASVDTDRDGYPDAWNTGRTQADSTTGLTLDAFPQDSACWLAAHGSGTTCNYGATIPNYIPDQVVQNGDTVYLLSTANRRVYRWSIATGAYLNPYVVGINQGFSTVAPTKMAYSSGHQRLYLGYNTGAIRYIDVTVSAPVETAFSNTAMAVGGLAAVGNYVLAQDGSGAWATHYVINSAGVITDSAEWNHQSPEYAWEPVTSRVYYFSMWSPADLNYEVIDQATGQITSSGETPYHGSYNIQPPIRVSGNGQLILLGSGDIYAQNGLTWSGSLGSQIADARWLANGSLVTLTSANNQTTLRRLGATNLGILEQLSFTGTALRVVGTDARMAVLVQNAGTVQFQIYVPNDDSDGDGVLNTVDAFPLDRAASVDTDGDGYPDAWNAECSQADSTTGLTLDAFPQDSACYLPSHGSGGVCNYGATIPNYTPDQVATHGDVIYLLSSANRRVYRRSISTGAYLNPYVVGINQGFSFVAPTTMALSSGQQRLYLGYDNGAIRYIDVSGSNTGEVQFANTALAVRGLASVGNYLLAQDSSGAWATHYVINSAGVITDSAEWNYYSRDYAYDPVTSRVYFFRDDTSPNDLHYEVIDQATGQIASTGETPYHGSYNIQPPIRVSGNGQNILLGSGDIYAATGLAWSGSLGSQIADARWLANGSLVTLTTANNQTTLRRLSSTNLATLEQLSFTGQALRVVGSDTAMVVLVLNNGTVQFHNYIPNDDSDGDGVLNTADAFPLDRAASVDTDRDGYPDAWNPGRTQADSTTGLTLDSFPNDSACYLPSHGTGGVCNYGATIPNYTPDQVASQGDVIYLLSSINRRVYRRSISTGAYLNPYIVGINQGFSTVAPTTMAYSSAQQRLYLGYDTGAIRYIDVTAGSPTETAFANTALAVRGLASVGNYLLAQDDSGAWATHYVINSAGVITDSAEWNHFSREYAWDPNTSRVYFLRDDTSPNDLHYEVIDQATGQIASAGEAPYHGDHGVGTPIRVSVNGQYVLLGTGDLYDQNGLTWVGAVGSQLADARWFANGSLVTLTTASNQTTLRRLGATNLTTLEQLTFTGQALRVVGSDTAMVVLVLNNGTVQFHNYVPNDDSDGDGVLNTADAFPLDRAASVDTDQDGYPDAWNPGRTQADSTTGLTLDAFPQDSACYLPSHGIGGVCNYGATIPAYIPDQVAQNGDTVYLLSSANRRVYRWSISTGAYLNPYIVGINQGFSTVAPTTMAYSSGQQRLYLGYSTGAIRYIDVTGSAAEVGFANSSTAIQALVSAGNYVLAQATSGSYVFSTAGVITAQGWGYGVSSRDYAWDAVNSRVYFFRDGYSPNDLHYAVINQGTGLITSSEETPYHGAYSIEPPIRVSTNGAYVLLGSGDIYNQSGLTWSGSLGLQVSDARWLANGSLVTLATGSNQTTLRRLSSSNLALLEQVSFTGQALRVLGSDTAMVVLVNNNGTVQFHSYVPNDDSDNDGVLNAQDAFPLDRAASVDTDRDGYPDAWNPGRSQADSTTGLTLDSFPQDAACWLPAHGTGGVCNYSATIPNYVPDQVVSTGDTVYLLSSANRRVYRWSIATGEYLNPYIVGINQGFATIAPNRMAYSSAHQRLYFGYETGAIRYIDVTATGPTEVPFANVATAVGGLASVGNYVLAQDYSGAWATHYVINSAGIITDSAEWNYSSPEFTWDPVSSRVYFFRDHSPSDLHFEEIDQATGQIASAGETPYHGDYGWTPPIRVSPDGEQILTGGGSFFSRSGLNLAGSLGKAIKDAQWTGAVLVDVDTTDRVEIRDANTRAVLRSYQYLGQPLRVVFGTTEAYLVHVMNNTTAFIRLPFYDQDADLIARWWEDLYGLSDSNAADALTDLDSDGVNNLSEYQHQSNPQVADTDGDGLTDQQEIVTYNTNPAKVDTDGDGLSDQAEVVTHHSDPNDTDSDNDGYTDFDEVLYGGNPNDPSGVPQPLTTYSQTFEGTPNLAAWTMPSSSSASWATDTLIPHAGTASFKSGSINNGQTSSVRFRGFFTAGALSFWARVDSGSCCNRMDVYIDGVQSLYLSGGPQWYNHTLQMTLGIHEIEWRYQRDSYGGLASDSARIDDVVFTGQ